MLISINTFSCSLPFLQPPAQSPSTLQGQQQPPTASPCEWELMPQRSESAFVCSCCYSSFQWEIHAFRLLQIAQKSLFTPSQLLCDLHSHPGLCWIWPTDFKQSFVCSFLLMCFFQKYQTEQPNPIFIFSSLLFWMLNCNSGPYNAGKVVWTVS